MDMALGLMLLPSILFAALILISGTAALYGWKKGKNNIWIYTIKVIPAVCAFAGMALAVVALFLNLKIRPSNCAIVNDIYDIYIKILPTAIFMAGVALYVHGVKKKGFNTYKIGPCLIVGLMISASPILILVLIGFYSYMTEPYEPPYNGTFIDNTYIQSQRYFAIDKYEYYLTVKFDNDEWVTINPGEHWGRGIFRVFRMPDGNLYLKALEYWEYSYMLDLSAKKMSRADWLLDTKDAEFLGYFINGTLYPEDDPAIKDCKFLSVDDKIKPSLPANSPNR